MITMNKKSKQISLKEAFLLFQNYNKAKNLSADTIKSYEENYKYFTNFFGRNRKCNELNEDIMIGYVNHMLDDLHIKKITVNTRIGHIKVFFRFCMKRGYMQEFEIKKMRLQETVKDLYTDREIEILLKKPNMEICNFSEYRTWIICNLIYSLRIKKKYYKIYSK